ncbi:MAG: radical SAM/Cys-rich domain protein [Deltaproteobacteria bacterium]|nr:radical SAM/Cys-rich domain protein [Deltaproteobacteria bacterium]TLN02750.1 MAG: radical SAM/Cys-rich domain protein [bacterium]
MTQTFSDRLKNVNPDFLSFSSLKTLQVNLGNLCNMACAHCHVSASPAGEKKMVREVAEKIVAVLRQNPGIVLDLTGGCPELNPQFRYLVEATESLSLCRIVRSNLTVVTEPGMEWLVEFYRQHKLVVFGSLPCYSAENVEKQRGSGVFERSITALKKLNSLGYGSELELNLVYNPGGPFLPGSQRDLEAAYRKELAENFGIRFSNLFTITNAPIGRFRDFLEQKGVYEKYLALLADRFNPETAGAIMCRSMVSVDWQGYLYNCDFNQVLGLPVKGRDGRDLTIDQLAEAVRTGSRLELGQHCYCCTAGEGSSCTGSLAA